MSELLYSVRAQEVAALSATSDGQDSDDLAEFYQRFNKIKDYHARNPTADQDLRAFAAELQSMVESDGLQRTRIEGEEEDEVIDRKWLSLRYVRHCLTWAGSSGRHVLRRRGHGPLLGSVHSALAIYQPEGSKTASMS